MIQSHQNYVTGATPTSDVPASQGEVFDMEVALPSFHTVSTESHGLIYDSLKRHEGQG